ncbi:hypothetical protein DB313_05420 (plasmid) [Borrelia turcica IST7]|uniref:Uncharacterized protein n=1 Tax=Borrelia turcica IST7 TaxID=1104446 RepID=A0A386PQN3_9SPIR|nr:hypothetical protein [Borrelia turcica]AYE36940.1 hypothetical protein DB313_05420 [Borrelia turcica IST7]
MIRLIYGVIKANGRFMAYLDRIDPAGVFKSFIGFLLFGILYFTFCYLYTLPLYRHDKLLDEFFSAAKVNYARNLYEEYKESGLK